PSVARSGRYWQRFSTGPVQLLPGAAGRAGFRRNERRRRGPAALPWDALAGGAAAQEARRPWLRYFRRVASPPRICRSALLRSRIRLTLRARSLLTRGSRSVTSLWTVL